MSDMVKDVGVAFSGIGITTGSYREKGRLKIDETRLKNAIKMILTLCESFSKNQYEGNVDLSRRKGQKI